ncbi:MAG: hypothetical protein QM737_12075 [Ferruginibacter sp.]
MKYFGFILVFTLCLQANGNAQKITYSEYLKNETSDIFFEILGKVDSNYVVYKNVRQKHLLTKYDNEMNIVGNIPLDFVPERTFNIDFIVYRNFYYLVWQYQKNSIVYCMAMKMDLNGKQLNEPLQLDTTRISILADNKIYTTIFSEDKQKILVYKRQLKDETLTLVTKLYDSNLQLLDSTRAALKFNDDKEVYSDLALDNNGIIVFAKETKRSRKDTATDLEITLHKPGLGNFRTYKISLGRKIIEEIEIKPDNLNKHFIINSFYYGQRKGSIEGLFTSFIDMNGEKPIRAAFNHFSDSFRYSINSDDQARFVFDNLVIRNAIVKKNGGFILSAEDFYTESLFNNAWNRQYYNSPFVSSYDYYLSSPYYYGYRPYRSDGEATTRYYYNDVAVLSVDSALHLEWNSVIHKKQYDVDNENYLSFGLMNQGGEIHYLFIDRDRQKQVITNQSILPSGQVKRYPTLKSNEVGYGFMPKLAKQTGAKQMIIPLVYGGRIMFAKVDF